MGRASRQNRVSPDWTNNHPDRRFWTPEQAALAKTMSQAAYEALYGRSRAERQMAFSSSVMRHTVEPAEIDQTNSLAELRELIDKKLKFPSEIQSAEGDPLFEYIWEHELRRMQKQSQEIDSHWLPRDEKIIEEMRQVWLTVTVPELLSRNWTDNRPYSLLAAYLEIDPGGYDKLSEMLLNLRQNNPVREHEFFSGEIAPEVDHLARPLASLHPPSAALTRELWRGIGGEDVRSHHALLFQLLQRGGGDAEGFAAQPISAKSSSWQDRYFPGRMDRYPSLEQEAFMDLSRVGLETSALTVKRTRAAAECVFRKQIAKIYYGSEEDREAELWKTYADHVLGSTALQRAFGARVPSPLDNLRPIFIAEGEEDLYQEMTDLVSREIREASRLGNGSPGYLRMGKILIYGVDCLDQIDKGKTVSSQIFTSINQACLVGDLR